MNVFQRMMLNMGFHPRNGASDGYPFDLDASERRVRPASGIDIWPTHSNADNFAKLGLVSGFLPEMDTVVWAMGFGKMPSGPIVSALPQNLQYQMNIPGLNKQVAQSD